MAPAISAGSDIPLHRSPVVGSDISRIWVASPMKKRRRTSRPSLALTLLCGIAFGAYAAGLVFSVDRTTHDWSDLAMGGPAADDDADTSRGPRALVR
jgi:hypothetical protein